MTERHEKLLKDLKCFLTLGSVIYPDLADVMDDLEFLWAGKMIEHLIESGLVFTEHRSISASRSATFWRERRQPQMGMCFQNALLFATEFQCFQYYEGYTFDGRIPFEHAWTVAPDGMVYDHTLEEADKALQARGERSILGNCVFLGLPVPLEFMIERIRRTQTTTPGLTDYLIHTGAIKQE